MGCGFLPIPAVTIRMGSRDLLMRRAVPSSSTPLRNGPNFESSLLTKAIIAPNCRLGRSYLVRSGLGPPDFAFLAQTARVSLIPDEVEEFASKIGQVVDCCLYNRFGQLQVVDRQRVQPSLQAARWGKLYKHLDVRSFASINKSGNLEVKKKKRRLDEICLERFQQYSRTYIQSWILQGKVCVDGRVVNKAGTPVSDTAVVEILAQTPKYVCRAGHKLEAAIEQFNVDVAGKVALDSGLSTGGFTDCLLQYGASFVYGVDVGYGQVADKIRHDKRVCVVERTNLRYLSRLPQKVDLVTLDLSFISILKVMPAVVNVMKEEAILVTLVKPQFEARRSQVGKGGIVRDPLVHQEVREMIIIGIEKFGFHCKGWIESPLKGAEGNTEFLICFTRAAEESAN